MCMAHGGGGGFRGPPVPLILVPVVIHLVRSSCDAKMATYLREISKGGPVAIAENAHRVAQYALSKLPANVLWWFTSKVLNLSPEVAMQTTEFLKSRTELDASALPEPDTPSRHQIGEGGKAAVPALMPSDVELRLERLEQHYHALQQKHEVSLRLLADKPEAQEILVSRRMRLTIFLLAISLTPCDRESSRHRKSKCSSSSSRSSQPASPRRSRS